MVTSQTLPHFPELTAQQAELWIAAALAEAQALAQHDDQFDPHSVEPGQARAAQHLRAAWQAWLSGAEAILTRVKPLLRIKQHLVGAHDLDYAIGRAAAMLSVSPEQLRARREQLQRGETHSIQEARVELRDSDRR